MLSASDIRNVKFSKSMGGYKQEEVDVLLDKIEADYLQFERTVKEFQGKIDSLNSEIESYRGSQNSIQNVLLSAQKLADQIVNEAKEKSADIVKKAESSIAVITAQEKELATAFEIKAGERKSNLEKELDEKMRIAKAKTDSIAAATEDSVARQQALFDRLKMEVAAFKADITKTYKEHLEMLQKLPDSVPMDPKHISGLISEAFDKEPDINVFIKKADNVNTDTLSDNLQNETDSYEKKEPETGFTVADPTATV